MAWLMWRPARGAELKVVLSEDVLPDSSRTCPTTQGDPFRTLFVSRLSYDVTEKKLRREFEEYGPIKRVRIVTDKNGGCRLYFE